MNQMKYLVNAHKLFVNSVGVVRFLLSGKLTKKKTTHGTMSQEYKD